MQALAIASAPVTLTSSNLYLLSEGHTIYAHTEAKAVCIIIIIIPGFVLSTDKIDNNIGMLHQFGQHFSIPQVKILQENIVINNINYLINLLLAVSQLLLDEIESCPGLPLLSNGGSIARQCVLEQLFVSQHGLP